MKVLRIHKNDCLENVKDGGGYFLKFMPEKKLFGLVESLIPNWNPYANIPAGLKTSGHRAWGTGRGARGRTSGARVMSHRARAMVTPWKRTESYRD